MKTLLNIFCILGTVISLAAGNYVIKTVNIQPIESYPARSTVEGITIAADPYDSDKKAYSAFDVKDLNSRGYFPVHVIIQNMSTDFLIVRTRNILLITSSGEQLYSTPIAAILEDIFNPTEIDKLSNTNSRKASKRVKIGTPLSDFTDKDLTNKLIDPGKLSGGFLFFTNPDAKKNILAGSTLFIPKIEEEGTRKSIGPFYIKLSPALTSSK